MKKIYTIILTFSLFLIGTNLTKAQCWEEGKVAVSIGYGFPNLGKSLLNAFDSNTGYKATGFGPLHVKGDYALTDKFSFGVSMNFVNYGATYTVVGNVYDPTNTIVIGSAVYDNKISVLAYSINARMNFHFATTDKVDPYWGIGAGYGNRKITQTSTDPNYAFSSSFTALIPIGFETTIGCRFFFTENIGAFTEIGWSKSLIQAGLTAKF